MRIRSLSFLVWIFCLSLPVFSMHSRRMAASADIVGWVQGSFRFQFESSLSDQLALTGTLPIGIKEVVLFNNLDETYWEPQVGLKYYATGNATQNGLYVQPRFGIGFLTPGSIGDIETKTAIYLLYGFSLGYALDIYKGLWLDSYIMLDSKATSLNKIAAIVGSTDVVNLFAAGILLGYAW